MRRIKEGHSVTVWYVDGPPIKGVVENTPSNTGDLWFIRDNKGVVQAINPSCSRLERIERTHIEEKE